MKAEFAAQNEFFYYFLFVRIFPFMERRWPDFIFSSKRRLMPWHYGSTEVQRKRNAHLFDAIDGAEERASSMHRWQTNGIEQKMKNETELNGIWFFVFGFEEKGK